MFINVSLFIYFLYIIFIVLFFYCFAVIYESFQTKFDASFSRDSKPSEPGLNSNAFSKREAITLTFSLNIFNCNSYMSAMVFGHKIFQHNRSPL